RHTVAFGEEFEMMDQRLDVALHLLPGRRGHLPVRSHHRSWIVAQPVDALANDAIRLPHLLDAHQVTVVAVAIHADGDIEIHSIVDLVRLLLAQIPGDAGTAQHRTREAELQCAFWRNHADVHRALLPDAVVGEQRLVLVDGRGETIREVLDEIEHAARTPLVQPIYFLLRTPLRR